MDDDRVRGSCLGEKFRERGLDVDGGLDRVLAFEHVALHVDEQKRGATICTLGDDHGSISVAVRLAPSGS